MRWDQTNFPINFVEPGKLTTDPLNVRRATIDDQPYLDHLSEMIEAAIDDDPGEAGERFV